MKNLRKKICLKCNLKALKDMIIKQQKLEKKI